MILTYNYFKECALDNLALRSMIANQRPQIGRPMNALNPQPSQLPRTNLNLYKYLGQQNRQQIEKLKLPNLRD